MSDTQTIKDQEESTARAASLSTIASGDLGRRAHRRRVELGLSVAELSSRTGLASTYISYLETSAALPTLSVLRALAHGLDTSVEELLGGGQAHPLGSDPAGPFGSLENLDVEQCRHLVKTAGICRVIYDHAPRLIAIPTNYQVVDGDFVILVSDTSELATILDGKRTSQRRATPSGPTEQSGSAGTSYSKGRRAAVQVDRIDDNTHEGWSVLVQCRARLVTDLDDIAALESRGPTPWAEGHRTRYVRLTPVEWSGRWLRSWH